MTVFWTFTGIGKMIESRELAQKLGPKRDHLTSVVISVECCEGTGHVQNCKRWPPDTDVQ